MEIHMENHMDFLYCGQYIAQGRFWHHADDVIDLLAALVHYHVWDALHLMFPGKFFIVGRFFDIYLYYVGCIVQILC